jgi:aspartate/glutamate racemase
VHDVIYNELCVRIVNEQRREEYRRGMRQLADRGAERILLAEPRSTVF